MPSSSCTEEGLAAAVRHGLLPSRFPYRRDVRVAGAVRCGAAYDVFWPRLDRLAVVAFRAQRADLSGALAMTAFRAVHRAVAPLCDDAGHALACAAGALEGRPGGGAMDIAIAVLDMPSRKASFASSGQAFAGALPLPAGEADHRPHLVAMVGSLKAQDIASRAIDLSNEDLERLVADEPGLAGIATIELLPKLAGARELVFVVDSQSAAIARVLPQIEERCREAGMGEEAIARLSLAIDEMAANVVSYAYGDGRAHEIVLRVSPAADRALVAIEDDGHPFDPLTVRTPDLASDLEDRPVGGLGVHLLRSVADDIRYARRRGWNVLTFAVGEPAGIAPI